MRNSLLVITLFLALRISAVAQDSTITYSLTLQGTASSAQTPFWLHTNQYGTIPADGSFVRTQAAVFKNYHPYNPRFFQWSAGIEVNAFAGKSSRLFFNDLFIAGKAGPVEVSMGQRKELHGLGDSLLSSGPIAMAPNTRTFPRIQISSVKYINLIPGNNFLSFRFSYSDGLLGSAKVAYGNVTEVPAIYLHQKSLYFKLGGHRQKLNLFAGFNHQVIWGGEAKIFSGGLNQMQAYKYIVFGKAWAFSRVGNHFGTIDVGAEWHGADWSLFAYRQSIYEDGSLSNLSNITDGLNGLKLRINKDPEYTGFQINTILFEFLYTKNQGGATFDFVTGTFGMDNYFNHYVYPQGWSYRHRSLGTPIIAPQGLFRDDLPSDSTAFTTNNRIAAYHLGINASLKNINFLAKGTFSANYGTYRKSFSPPVYQSSILISAETPLSIRNASHLSLSLAADFGKLYPTNSAIMLGWRRTGIIR